MRVKTRVLTVEVDSDLYEKMANIKKKVGSSIHFQVNAALKEALCRNKS
jgi:predicted transcriptional regulator